MSGDNLSLNIEKFLANTEVCIHEWNVLNWNIMSMESIKIVFYFKTL